MSEHEEQARAAERELADMEERSERVGAQIDEARADWKAKQADDAVPGATGEPDDGRRRAAAAGSARDRGGDARGAALDAPELTSMWRARRGGALVARRAPARRPSRPIRPGEPTVEAASSAATGAGEPQPASARSPRSRSRCVATRAPSATSTDLRRGSETHSQCARPPRRTTSARDATHAGEGVAAGLERDAQRRDADRARGAGDRCRSAPRRDGGRRAARPRRRRRPPARPRRSRSPC